MGEKLEQSTYMHDFLWPCLKKEEPKRSDQCGQTPCCLCHEERGLENDVVQEQEESPSNEKSPCEKPSLFLKKLNEKYPYLYNVMKMSPEDAVVARVYADRVKSTYQVDFNKSGEIPANEYTKLLPLAAPPRDPCFDKYSPPAHSKKAPCDLCGVPVNGTGPGGSDPSGDPRNQRPIAFRSALISKQGFMKVTSSNKPANPKTSGVMQVTTYGISEYADSISRNGANIIKQKIHFKNDNKD